MRKYIPSFFLLIFLVGTDTFLVSPLLPTLTRIYHISTATSGWITSAYAIGYLIVALVAGPISDNHDKKRVMLSGFLGFAIATFLCSFAATFWLMLPLRFLAGAFAAVASPQVWASIPVVINREHVIRAMGYVSAALSVSQLAGVPIGSFLATISWRAPFIAIGACSLILCVAMQATLPSLNPASNDGGNASESLLFRYKTVLSNKLSVAAIIGYFCFQTGNFSVLNFTGTWLNKDFSLSLAGIGTAMIAIGCGNLIGTTLGGRISERIGIRRSMFIGFAALAVLYLLLPFAPNAYWATAGLMVVMLINGFVFPLFMALLQSATTNARSTMSSLGNAAMYAGSSVAGAIGGGLMTTFPSFFGIAYFTIAMLALSLVVYTASGSLKLNQKRTGA